MPRAAPRSAATGGPDCAYGNACAGEFDEKNPGIWGDSELIERDPKTGELLGGQDQRHHFGKAAGY